MDNRPTVSIEELEAVKAYLAQEGSYMETMFCEYKECIAELLTTGIISGEVHNSLVFYLQSAEIMTDKFKILGEMACEQVTILQTAVTESDETILF